MVAGCGAHRSDSVGAACSGASPLRSSVVRLNDFDVFGASSRTARDASDPLFPKYPNALLPQKFRLQARHRLTEPLRVTALDCRSGQPVLFYVKSGLNQPPETPQRFRHNGVRSVTLSWPPTLTAPDPPSWFLSPLFYEPGIGVITFSRGDKVIEQLSLRVCIPKPGPSGDC